jgi:hypothetical protein
MNYSKRQLYALGEPLGDSVTVKKVGGGRIYGGGGGGSSAPAPAAAPTQTTVQNTNIPEYAQPYVENMLNAAQAQIYTPDMKGFNPYTPYSTNPQDYVAGFSPLQQQAQSSAANLQVPGSMGVAQGMTAAGTLGAFGAGQNYANQATNPYAMQSYMNPYLNNALQPQLAEIGRQYDITGTQQMGNATRSGAFGGNREALMASENQRNKNIAMNQAIGTGYNNAFQQAQQAQQFGANLGLQGIQAGLGGASQLSNQGAAELAARQGIIGTQASQGATEQQNQQNIINQAVQNYATAQQYPYLQLGTLNSMLRGLPMQQSSTQMYQAAPNQVSQLAGLGTAGLGAAAMYNAAKGAKGGLGEDIKGYAPGGAIPMKSYSDEQLKQVQKSKYTDPMDKLYAQGLQLDHGYMRGNPEAAKLMAQSAQPMPQMPSAGLGNAPTGNVIPQQFAAGGIMSFADEGEVPPVKANPVDDALAMYADKSGKVDLNKAALALLGQAQSGKEATKDERAAIEKSLKEQHDMGGARALTRFGLNLAAQPGQYLGQNVAQAGLNTLNTYEKEVTAERELKRQLAKLDAEGAAKDDARRLQLAGTLLQIQGQRDMKMAALANAPSGEEKAILKVQALINQDDQIPQLIKQRDMETPGTTRYNAYNDAINSIKKSYFEQVGIKRPYVAPVNVQFPQEPEKESWLSSLNPFSSKPAAPQNKVAPVPFSQLPTKG